MSVEEHKAKGKRNINCFVVTVSDTRDETTDESGQLIKSFLADEKHLLAGYRIVKDEPAEIAGLLREALANQQVEASYCQRRDWHFAPRRNLRGHCGATR